MQKLSEIQQPDKKSSLWNWAFLNFLNFLFLGIIEDYLCVWVCVGWAESAMSKESSSGDHGGNNFHGVQTHGGRYVQYNLYGNLFEVSRKYVPLRPVGRGAYGIVW